MPLRLSRKLLGTGSGTVTAVSVTTANGVSGSVANSTTTPTVTLTLGNITPSRIITTGDVAVNSSSTGMVLKDSGGHYWRIGISTLGVISGTDLGTSYP